MDWKKHGLQTATLVGAAVICALISNAVAGRTRQVVLVGTYPNALKVPARAPEPAASSSELPPATAQTAQTDTGVIVETASAAPATSTATTTTAVPATPTATAPAAATVPAAPAQTATTTAAAKPAPARVNLIERFPPHEKPYVEIGGDDVMLLHANGALFLDARRTNIYEQGHIAGARNFAVWEADIDEKVGSLVNDATDQQQPIVIYCSGGECEDSHMLAQKLFGVFYTNILVYKDGFPDWQKRGGAVRTGGNP